MTSTDTSRDKRFATARSCAPSPLKSPTTTDFGCSPAGKRCSRAKLPFPKPSSTETSFDTAFATVRAAAKTMRTNGGSVVLMASSAATVGLPSHEAIAAAKAGVIGLGRSAAATYASKGIRFNVIAPGLVETPMSAKITGNPLMLKASEAMHPLGRIGRPDEVASMIAWLLGEESAWVTGQVFGLDGGMSTVRSKASA